MFCVAALSVGCADDPVNPGSYTAGLRPAKPSLEFPADPNQVNVTITGERAPQPTTDIRLEDTNIYVEGVNLVKGFQDEGPNCVDNCETIAIIYPDGGYKLTNEVRLVSDGGTVYCRIYLTDGGVVDECGLTAPKP
jgi:hypothetical protein